MVADDANAKHKDIARLYPGSEQIWVDSGHGIPLEKPEVVIAAIREALLLRTTGQNLSEGRYDLAIFLWTPGSLSGLPILEIPG